MPPALATDPILKRFRAALDEMLRRPAGAGGAVRLKGARAMPARIPITTLRCS